MGGAPVMERPAYLYTVLRSYKRAREEIKEKFARAEMIKLVRLWSKWYCARSVAGEKE